MPLNRCSFELAGFSGVLGENNNKISYYKHKNIEIPQNNEGIRLVLAGIGKKLVPSKELIFVILVDTKDLSHVPSCSLYILPAIP